ncbi:MAG: ATP-binding protein [Armatimonadota bacterium]
MDDEYTENPIRILKGLEAVRLRPGMFIGDTDTTGYHHMAFEVIDNAVQEAKAGFCSNITVTLYNEHTLAVEDDGQGFPIEIHPYEQRSMLEVLIASLHAGCPPFNGYYRVWGGLHGVGLPAVNGLSESFTVDTYRDGIHYRVECAKGVITQSLQNLGPSKKRGSCVIFTTDREIFGDKLTFSPEILRRYLHRFAYLLPSARITFQDKTSDTVNVFQFPDGIRSWVRVLNEGLAALHPIAYAANSAEQIQVAVAVQYHQEDTYRVIGCVNGILTELDSSELIGFYAGLIAGLSECSHGPGMILPDLRQLTEEEIAKALDSLDFNDDSHVEGMRKKRVCKQILNMYRRGLTAVVSVWLTQPRFMNTMKLILHNPEVEPIVTEATRKAVIECRKNNPEVIRALVSKLTP